MTPLQRLGGRKFLVAMFSILSSSSLAWFGKIDPGVYSVVMVATAAAYITGNVVQKATVKVQP